MSKKITIIAEIGENHIGKISYARKMIVQAKKAGADYVKFQSYNKKCLKKKIQNTIGLRSFCFKKI